MAIYAEHEPEWHSVGFGAYAVYDSLRLFSVGTARHFSLSLTLLVYFPFCLRLFVDVAELIYVCMFAATTVVD